MNRIEAALLILAVSAYTATAQPGRPGMRGGPSYPRQSVQRGTGQTLNSEKSSVYGTVLLAPEKDGEKEHPAASAVVTIITATGDTLHSVANDRGFFMFRAVPVGKATVSFSMMGFKTITQRAEIQYGDNRMLATLKPLPFEIDAAVLKEDIAAVSVVGDTVFFNPAAVKVNKGEKMIDILEQMPGVEVSGGGITVLNEEVKNVYIDGTLIFGDSPMNAVDNLDAEEVVGIKSYQEYANKDPYHKISRTEEKQRVLDVATKSKLKSYHTINAVAGGGFDTDSTYHKFRYTLGVDTDFFSETFQAGGRINANNINDDSNRRRGNSFRSASGGGSADLKNLSGRLNVKKKWMSPDVRNFVLGSMSASYSASDRFNVNESLSQQIYFPSEDYESRIVDRRSYSDATDKTHSFSLDGAKALHDGEIHLGASMKFTGSDGNRRSSNYSTMDAMPPQGTSSSTKSGSDGSSYSIDASFRKGFNNRVRLSVGASYSFSDNENMSVKHDTTTSTVTYQVLEINGLGKSSEFHIGPALRFEIDDNRALALSWTFSDSRGTKEQVAMDMTDPTAYSQDLLNSYTYTTAHNTNDASVSFNNRFGDSEAILRMKAGYKSVGIDRDETFPEPDLYNRRFSSVYANIGIGTESMMNKWRLSWSTDASVPSIEQVRPRLNNRNLYAVSIGNPELIQTRSHNISFSYSSPVGREARETLEQTRRQFSPGRGRMPGRKGGKERVIQDVKMFNCRAEFGARMNPIVREQTFYAKETYLPEYDYTMPAQSTLSTYGNGSTALSASMSAKYDTPLKKIQCMLSISGGVDWDKSPSWYNTQCIETMNLRPSMRMNLRTNFSRNLRINTGLNASYVNSMNSIGDRTDYFTERLNLGWDVNNVFRLLYFGGNYFKLFTQGIDYGEMSDNIMDLNIGAKWGPRNNHDLSLNVHDLFNNTTGFSTGMTANFIRNSWNHSFGRYVMLDYVYRFSNIPGKGRNRQPNR